MEFSVSSFDEGVMASVWLVEFDHLSSLSISEMCVWRLSVWFSGLYCPGKMMGEEFKEFPFSSSIVPLIILKKYLNILKNLYIPDKNCLSVTTSLFFDNPPPSIILFLCPGFVLGGPGEGGNKSFLSAWMLQICFKDELQLGQNGSHLYDVKSGDSSAHTC